MSKVRNKLGQFMTAETVSLNSDTRAIEVCNDKIIYTLKLDGVKDYLSYKHWRKNDNSCWCLEIQNSLHAQKILSLMTENEFQTVSFDTYRHD